MLRAIRLKLFDWRNGIVLQMALLSHQRQSTAKGIGTGAIFNG
jgi:hypothetical protein